MTHRLEREQWVPANLGEIFAFFSDPRNLQELTPAWLSFQILDAGRSIAEGDLLRYWLRWHGIPIRWTTQITRWDPPHTFVDLQLQGPYRLWRHTHRFESSRGGTRITDSVEYALPLGWLGRIAHRLKVRRDVESIFDYRQQRIREMFA